MNIYVLFLIILCCAGAALMVAVYAVFRKSLASKMFALIIPTEIIVAQLSFILGGEQAPAGLLAVLTPIGVGVVVLALLLIYRFTIQPLAPLTRVMDRIASDRDLSELPPVSEREDEIRAIQQAFFTMTRNMRDLLGQLQDGVNALATSSAEIETTVQQAASSASEQAAVVVEVSATVEEIRQSSKAAAESAEEVSAVAETAFESGRRGVKAVASAVGTMDEIAADVDKVASRMEELRTQNEQIGEIVETVNELAEQSNLLAVNASIEAARAGEHGRGFSAVASEVRGLAEQSKTATKQIQGILRDIRVAADALLVATAESRQRAGEGRMSMEALRVIIDDLLAVLEQASDQARQISAGSSQQAAGISQIAQAMEQVSQGGRDSESQSRQLERAVADLAGLGKRLQSKVSDYTV